MNVFVLHGNQILGAPFLWRGSINWQLFIEVIINEQRSHDWLGALWVLGSLYVISTKKNEVELRYTSWWDCSVPYRSVASNQPPMKDFMKRSKTPGVGERPHKRRDACVYYTNFPGLAGSRHWTETVSRFGVWIAQGAETGSDLEPVNCLCWRWKKRARSSPWRGKQNSFRM